jgi:codanin-1
VSPEGQALLKEFENSKADFVPFLLNFLRDQTLHLMQGWRSTSTTPAKTPGSLKLKKWASQSKKRARHSEPKACSTPVSRNRQQLFVGSDNLSLATPDSFRQLDDTNSPIVASVDEPSTKETSTNNFHVYRKSKPQERDHNASQSQRNLSFQHHGGQQQRSKACSSLGDFLLSPEMNSRQNKHSPHSNRCKDKVSPMQRNNKKGKHKNQSAVDPPPRAVFNLSDFPTVGESRKQENSQ